MIKRHLPVDLPVGYIDFFKDLESWQNEQEIRIKQQYEFAKLDLLQILSKHHKPLLSIKKYEFNQEDYYHLVEQVLNFIKVRRPETSEAVEKITARLDNLDLKAIMTDLTQGENSSIADLSSQLGVSFELLFFIMDHAFRPFLRVIAAPYHNELIEDDLQSWNYPTICPICGSRPHLSRLRASDGRRFMFCDRCFTEWESQYLQCVFCGNNQPETIKYLSIEDNDAYQIYTCDECKGYLKTYDERQTGRPVDMYIANMETIYLDIIAQDNGYTNHDQD